MRVLMVSWEFPPHTVGGLGRHVADIAPELAAQGVDLHIITPLIGDAPQHEQPALNLHVHRVAGAVRTDDRAGLIERTQRANTSLEAEALALHADVGGFDLIHAHDWLAAFSSVALQHALQRPLVATIHSLEWGRMQGHIHTPQSWWIHNIERELATNAARIITVSRYMAHQAHDVLHVSPGMIDVIYNGVTLPCAAAPRPAPNDEQRCLVRRRYAADHEALICFVGRLVHEKGAHMLLAALPRIRERVPHAKLVIAGTGPERDHLRHQAEASGMADHVQFVGYISDDARNELYGVADVAVFPSLYEPFGIVALEAMSYGCPVVVSATGGLAEIVDAHETGITTEPGNPDSLAWGVLHTLQHPDWAAARTTNALRVLQTTYSWQRIAAQTIDTYRHVVAAWHDDARGQDTASANERSPVQHGGVSTMLLANVPG